MGDRAYAHVLCHTAALAVFEELGFGEEEYGRALPEGTSFLVDSEANYGNASGLRDLAAKGHVFIAQHDAGGDYDACRIASDGKAYSEVDAMVHEQRPCVPINSDGSIDKKQLRAVRQYWRTVARAKQQLGLVGQDP